MVLFPLRPPEDKKMKPWQNCKVLPNKRSPSCQHNAQLRDRAVLRTSPPNHFYIWQTTPLRPACSQAAASGSQHKVVHIIVHMPTACPELPALSCALCLNWTAHFCSASHAQEAWGWDSCLLHTFESGPFYMRMSEQLSRMRARKGHHHYEIEKWDSRSNQTKRKKTCLCRNARLESRQLWTKKKTSTLVMRLPIKPSQSPWRFICRNAPCSYTINDLDLP